MEGPKEYFEGTTPRIKFVFGRLIYEIYPSWQLGIYNIKVFGFLLDFFFPSKGYIDKRSKAKKHTKTQ